MFKTYAFEMLNLYIYASKVEDQDLGDIHTDVVRVITERFQNNPGLMEFLRSIENEWAASEELYRQIAGGE